MSSQGESHFRENSKKLYKAIECHDEGTVRTILNLYDNFDPNKLVTGLSMTFLHFAVGVSEDSTTIVEELLSRGGNPNNFRIEEKVSPMHLSVIYDYEKVLNILVRYGGDPKIVSGDGKSCYDIATENVETEMKEKCFLYFYRRSLNFRKSIKPSDSLALLWKSNHTHSLSTLSSLTDDFYTCDDQSSEDFSGIKATAIDSVHEEPSNRYSYLMTEDESECSSVISRLSTIPEESTVSNQLQIQTPIITYNHSVEDMSDISSRNSSISGPSYVNSTPPLEQEPTKQELANLQCTMKNLCIPVTQSTYRVLNRFAQDESKLVQVLLPKPGTQNFSSELKLSLQNLNFIEEWGNLKIQLLQSFTPTGKNKNSKSFYNYLLLDPKIIKRVNFSGNHLKSDIIRNVEKFETFLRSIFYIGKGCGRRPIQHLVDAKAQYSAYNRKSNIGEKLGKILEIWKSGLGVIVVSVFHYSSEREANVNEAAMIDAVGLVELSNLKKGSYGGTITTTWSQKAKNQLGSFLLYKCFCTFAVSDQRSFFPQDI